jgi:predicted lactoylglutathione lyase
MHKQIFVNLAVDDLEQRSKAFCGTTGLEPLASVSCEGRRAVNALVAKALAAGGGLRL